MNRAKKAILLILIIILFTGCSKQKNDIIFDAVVEQVSENSIIITTNDENVSFEKASVSFEDGYIPDFQLQSGQQVKITILPQIKESYPVQITATKIILNNADNKEEKVEYKKISVDEAVEMMTDDVIILDARTMEEYNQGHIKNAMLLPYDEINEKSASEKIPDKDKTVLVYCRTGRRSKIAAQSLIDLGYKKVYDFGGIETDWNGEIVK